MEERETAVQTTPEPAEAAQQAEQQPAEKKPKKKANKKTILIVVGVVALLLGIAFLNAAGIICIQHKWDAADCEDPKTCWKCGAQEGEKDPDAHRWNAADCTAPRTCASCGVTEGEKNPDNHAWDDATCIAPMTCWKCGETKGDTIGHEYDSDGICYTCGASRDSATSQSSDDEGQSESDDEADTSTKSSNKKSSTTEANNAPESESSSSSSNSSKRLTDEELEEVALQSLYSHLVALEGKYNQFEADYSRYEVTTIEHDGSGGVEVYGRVAFYDKHGSAVAFGGDYQRNFTVHTTEWGTTAWCEM